MIFKAKYTVGFFTDEQAYTEKKKKCLVQGETFSEAIKMIENTEGNELMSIEELIPLTPDNVIFIEDKSIWKSVTKDIENNAIW